MVSGHRRQYPRYCRGPERLRHSGAFVKLENVATGVTYSAAADENGAYRFHNVAYGSYRLSATARGFAGVTLNNVAAELNQSTTANLSFGSSP